MTNIKAFIIYIDLNIIIDLWSIYKYFMSINFMDSYV